MSDKEALERLTRLERQFQLWADDEVDSPVLLLDALTGAMPYLRTFIAEREGLEREVERQRDEIEQTRFLIAGGEDAPGYAMSLPFSEIERVAHENLATWNYDVERAEAAESKLSALSEAARPFAEVAQREDDAMDEMGIVISSDDMLVYDIDQTLTLGQCRALRALLHPTVPVERDLGSVASGLTALVASRVPEPGPATPSGEPSTGYARAVHDDDFGELDMGEGE